VTVIIARNTNQLTLAKATIVLQYAYMVLQFDYSLLLVRVVVVEATKCVVKVCLTI